MDGRTNIIGDSLKFSILGSQQKHFITIFELKHQLEKIKSDRSKLDEVYNPMGDTVLHTAIRLRNWELSNQLLDLGAKINIPNVHGKLPYQLHDYFALVPCDDEECDGEIEYDMSSVKTFIPKALYNRLTSQEL